MNEERIKEEAKRLLSQFELREEKGRKMFVATTKQAKNLAWRIHDEFVMLPSDSLYAKIVTVLEYIAEGYEDIDPEVYNSQLIHWLWDYGVASSYCDRVLTEEFHPKSFFDLLQIAQLLFLDDLKAMCIDFIKEGEGGRL